MRNTNLFRKSVLLIIYLIFITACQRSEVPLKIYFQRSGGGYTAGIWRMNEDGSNQELVVEGNYGNPNISADGSELICIKDAGIVYRFNSENFSVIKTYSFGAPITGLRLSSDNNYFEHYNPSIPHTIIINVKTGGVAWGPYNIGSNYYFNYTNDSVTIINGVSSSMYFISGDNTPINTRSFPLAFNNLTLSPDGTLLAGTTGGFIYLIEESDYNSYVELTTGNSDPSFSPDGQKLVFNEGNNIFSINIDGSGRKQLTFTGFDYAPVFDFKPK
jgi:hypothetical protein